MLTDHLDGNGYSIRNLKIQNKGAALFSFICSRCVVGNLSVVEARVQGAAIFARWNMGTINNVRAQGIFIPDFDPLLAFNGSDFGALVSVNKSGLIQNSVVDVRIEENTLKYNRGEFHLFTGGIAGWNNSGIISKVDVRGSMNVNWTAGGIVGRNLGTIRFAKSGLDIVTQHPLEIGGLVGDNSGTVSDSEASGNIRLLNAEIWVRKKNSVGVGGLVGVSFAPYKKEPRILNSKSKVKICGSVALGLLNENDLSQQPNTTQIIQPKPIVGLEISSEHDSNEGHFYKILPEKDSGVFGTEDLTSIAPDC